MKTNFFLLIASLFLFISSCEKDKDPAKTTYQVINNVEKDVSETDPYLDGTLWEVIVYNYDADGDIIRQDNLDPIDPDGGKSEIIEVDPTCVKVKLSFKLLPPESDFYELANRLYVQAFTVISKGKNANVIIDGQTMAGGELKRSLGTVTSYKSDLRNVR